MDYDRWKLASPYEQSEAEVAVADQTAYLESDKCEVLVAFAVASPGISIDIEQAAPGCIECGADEVDIDLTIHAHLTVPMQTGGIKERVIQFLEDALAAMKGGA